ncbi:choice-of-anchor J domain-containing protein [Lewinella sp. LCG006]|uniref:T9SS-dependent choice-of-anchor J family protein n=1 Tax=Lewinella sp. LCG006 TaxID=3231911 RepID=UPI0034607C56
MNKLIATLLSSLIMLGTLSAQVIFEENFEGLTFPDGWTITTNATDGGWLVGSAPALSSQSFPIESNGSSRIIATNDDACNCNKSNEYLIMPPLDLSDVTSVVVGFDAFYTDQSYQGNQEDATIEVSLDGTTWTVLEDLHGHGSWDRHNVDLSAYAGETNVLVGFRYDDGGGWLYGFAIDNVTVEVPPALEVSLVELDRRLFGEVGRPLTLNGTIYNAGVNAINTLELSYSITGAAPVVETLEGLDIPAFSYYTFTMATPWIPDSPGVFEVEVSIVSVNMANDEDQTNNALSFASEIFDLVVPPNKITEFAAAPAIISEVEGATNFLDKPTDLDFFPILGKDELWVINQRTENIGGSTLTMSGSTSDNPGFEEKVDGNSWHFMSLPTGIAFSNDNFNFANSAGVQDANHNGGTFTGPALWSSDPEIYAQPSGGNGSHLDMLHGSPYTMGIAHEVDNVFWVYDDWNKDIVRYDFAEDHGPGNDDHSDGKVHRYKGIGITADSNIPNHLVLDKATGWLYFVDNGNDRVMRLDINSGTGSVNLPEINEPLAEHLRITGFTTETIIESGLEAPCGIEIFDGILYVGDYATGDIVAYDMANDFAEITRIVTGELGLTGIKIGPDGNLWFVNRVQNTLKIATPGDISSTREAGLEIAINLSPNPATDVMNVSIPEMNNYADAMISVVSLTGKVLIPAKPLQRTQTLHLANLPAGIYLLQISGNGYQVFEKIIVQR